ncbi:hypothetical protein D3C75_1019700 [compost metagenome]
MFQGGCVFLLDEVVITVQIGQVESISAGVAGIVVGIAAVILGKYFFTGAGVEEADLSGICVDHVPGHPPRILVRQHLVCSFVHDLGHRPLELIVKPLCIHPSAGQRQCTHQQHFFHEDLW